MSSQIKEFKLIIFAPEENLAVKNILLELTSDTPFQDVRRGDIVSPFDHRGKPLSEYSKKFPVGDFLEIESVEHKFIQNTKGKYDTHQTEARTKIYKVVAKNTEVADAAPIIEIDTRLKTLEDALHELSKKMILATDIKNNGNISRTARELGMTRRGLYMKMEAYKISNYLK